MLTHSQRLDVFRQATSAQTSPLTADLAFVDRRPGQPQLEAACERVAAALSAAGADEVELATHGWGPEQRYFEWTGERAPHAEEAELYLLDADGERLLCRASEQPGCCLGVLRPTPDDGEIFELVNVGFGTLTGEYRRQIGGKIALASGHQANAAMFEALAQRDAAGLLLGPGDSRRLVARRFPGPAFFGGNRPFGFNLEPAQYHLLLGRLATGETVRVRVRSTIRVDSGERPVISGRLFGSDRAAERVAVIVDLCEVGGSGSIIALTQTLATLRDAIVLGTVPPPRRSIELAFVAGAAGAVGWLDSRVNGDAGESIATGRATRLTGIIQLSMPRLAIGDSVHVHPIAPGTASFLPDLVHDQLLCSASFAGPLRAETPLLARPSRHPSGAALPIDGITAAALIVALPSPENGSAAVSSGATRVIAATALAALELASLDDEDLPALIAATELASGGRLEACARRLRLQVLRQLEGDESQLRGQARDLMWQLERGMAAATATETRRIESCTRLFGGPGAEALLLAEANAALERQSERLQRVLANELRGRVGEDTRLTIRRRPLTALERRAQAVTLRRRGMGGPLPAALLLRDASVADRQWLVHHEAELASQPSVAEVIGALEDGATLLEIWERLRPDHPQVELKLLWRLLETLDGAGVVELTSPDP